MQAALSEWRLICSVHNLLKGETTSRYRITDSSGTSAELGESAEILQETAHLVESSGFL